MSASKKELETISLYDMVDDLVHDESEINEDQNNVDLSMNDSNQPFHVIGIQNHVLIWYLITWRLLMHIIMHMQGEKGFSI